MKIQTFTILALCTILLIASAHAAEITQEKSLMEQLRVAFSASLNKLVTGIGLGIHIKNAQIVQPEILPSKAPVSEIVDEPIRREDNTNQTLEQPQTNISLDNETQIIQGNETTNQTNTTQEGSDGSSGTGSSEESSETPPQDLPREEKVIIVDKHGDRKVVSRNELTKHAGIDQKRPTWTAEDKKHITTTIPVMGRPASTPSHMKNEQ